MRFRQQTAIDNYTRIGMVMNFRISEQGMAQFSQGYKSNGDAGYDDDERRMARRIDRHRKPERGRGGENGDGDEGRKLWRRSQGLHGLMF